MSGDIADIFDYENDEQKSHCPCENVYPDCPKPSSGFGWYGCSIINLIEQMSHVVRYTSSFGINDPDMLEVGNGGMTTAQYRTHFSFWAAFKSPLLLGTNLASLTNETLNIITNRNVIAVNQDLLMKSIERNVKDDHLGYQLWSGPLHDGSTVVLVLNAKLTSNTIMVNLQKTICIKSDRYIVHDLWTDEISLRSSMFLKVVEPSDTFMAKIVPVFDIATEKDNNTKSNLLRKLNNY